MRPILSLLLAAAVCAPTAVMAADSPPPAPPEAGQGPGQGPGGDRGGDRMRRMIENNPELKGVDPNTPEGREKINQAMAKQMRERMAENKAQQRVELQKQLGFTDEEFAAVGTLLDRVETLRQHRNLVDRAASGMGMMMGGRMGRGGPNGGGPGGPNFDPKNILGDTPLDPTAAEIQTALKALKALVDDAQSNANETELATARVRKSREAWTAAMTKAQEELRSVLNKRQEAILVERGTIE